LAFANIFKKDPALQDMQIVAIYGDEDRAESEKVQALFPDAVIVDKVADMLGMVDAVMITSRDGKHHYPYAKAFLEAGIPLFVDKPFTVTLDDAKALVALAKEKNVPLCGGSSVKYDRAIQELRSYVLGANKPIYGGALSAPIYLDSPYSGFYFYASHLTEMTLEIFGFNPKSATAVKYDNGVCATVHYDGFSVCNHFKVGAEDYSAALYTPQGLYLREVTGEGCFEKECQSFVDVVRKGQMHYTYEELMAPVYYMNAVKEAYETGKTVEIHF
jgi:predicted dehydrogenase